MKKLAFLMLIMISVIFGSQSLFSQDQMVATNTISLNSYQGNYYYNYAITASTSFPTSINLYMYGYLYNTY